MTDERFEHDLRATLRAMAPVEPPEALRHAVTSTVARPRVHRWVPGDHRIVTAVATIGLLAVVVAAVALLVTALPPISGPGAFMPTPRSTVITGFVEQTDGVYGYQMLRPVNWTATSGDFPNGRQYLAPGTTPAQGLAMRAVNLSLPAAHPAGPGGSVEWPVFQAAPTLEGWTAGLENLMRQEGQGFEPLRSLPAARIYDLPLPQGATGYAFIVAYAVDQGQPLIISLTATGASGDLDYLQRSDLLDDFVTMVGSLTSIEADAQRVNPSLPLAVGPVPAPTPETTPGIGPASPSPSLSADALTALDLATRYEMARAAGRWSEAWALLSAQSQAALGSLATFEAAEGAYNGAGGTTFVIQAPTQDPELVAIFPGAEATQIANVAKTSRGWLVFIMHPEVKGASAESEGLYVAPLRSGDWQVWTVH